MGIKGLFSRTLVMRAIRRARTSDIRWIVWLFTNARNLYRFVGRAVPVLHLGWVSQLMQVGWEDDTLRIQGWGYTRGTGFEQAPHIDVWLHRRFSRRRIAAVVIPIVDPQVAGAARRAEFDYSNTGFEARWDAASLARLGRFGAWQVRIQVSGGGRRFWGPVARISPFGSGAVMRLRRDQAGMLIGPVWHDRRGLLVVRREPQVSAVQMEANGREVKITLDGPVRRACLVSATQHTVELVSSLAGEEATFSARLPDRVPAFDPDTGRMIPASWSLRATRGRSEHPVHLAADDLGVRPGANTTLLVRGDEEQRLEVVDVAVFVEVESVVLEGDTMLRVEGRIVGDLPGVSLALVGRRARLPIELVKRDGERFVGIAPLRVSAWGGPELPPMRGYYSLFARVGEEAVATFVVDDFAQTLPLAHFRAEYRLRFELDRRDQFRLQVGRPRTPSEYGSFNQATLRQAYNYSGSQPRDAVFFESFFGRNATCNPRAIDAEVARRHPGLPRYWSVDDLSIAVPKGARPVVIGTTQWWEARKSSRWVVTNEWLRTGFRKQPFQTVLQTWHGSMYKKIGLDRANMNRRHYRLLREERTNWDMFISQNAPGTEIIKRAYDFADGDVIEAGYPRNDELHAVDDERRASIRARLDVPDGVRLVMYAPTWRLPDAEVADADIVDLPRLVRDLGPAWMLLVRGHVRTLGRSDALESDGILDVGTYPQVSELFMVADALITDYSSMMFDYSVTGKPMIFFTPDIDEYSDDAIRGAYFDLEALAPGPVVRTQDEVRALLTDGLSWHEGYREKYAEWNRMFNHLDDGMASRRATDALFRAASPAS